MLFYKVGWFVIDIGESEQIFVWQQGAKPRPNLLFHGTIDAFLQQAEGLFKGKTHLAVVLNLCSMKWVFQLRQQATPLVGTGADYYDHSLTQTGQSLDFFHPAEASIKKCLAALKACGFKQDCIITSIALERFLWSLEGSLDLEKSCVYLGAFPSTPGVFCLGFDQKTIKFLYIERNIQINSETAPKSVPENVLTRWRALLNRAEVSYQWVELPMDPGTLVESKANNKATPPFFRQDRFLVCLRQETSEHQRCIAERPIITLFLKGAACLLLGFVLAGISQVLGFSLSL